MSFLVRSRKEVWKCVCEKDNRNTSNNENNETPQKELDLHS